MAQCARYCLMSITLLCLLSGLGVLVVALCTDKWLHTIEKLDDPNNATVNIFKAAYSGLWRMCYHLSHNSNYSVLPERKMTCFFINYSPGYEVDVSDSTDAISIVIRNTVAFVIITLLLIAVSTGLFMSAFTRCRRNSIIMVSGILSVVSGLVIMVGLIDYIAKITGEVSNKLKPKSTFDIPQFRYTYGWSFMLASSSFVFVELAGVIAVLLFMNLFKRNLLKEELKRSILSSGGASASAAGAADEMQYLNHKPPQLVVVPQPQLSNSTVGRIGNRNVSSDLKSVPNSLEKTLPLPPPPPGGHPSTSAAAAAAAAAAGDGPHAQTDSYDAKYREAALGESSEPLSAGSRQSVRRYTEEMERMYRSPQVYHHHGHGHHRRHPHASYNPYHHNPLLGGTGEHRAAPPLQRTTTAELHSHSHSTSLPPPSYQDYLHGERQAPGPPPPLQHAAPLPSTSRYPAAYTGTGGRFPIRLDASRSSSRDGSSSREASPSLENYHHHYYYSSTSGHHGHARAQTQATLTPTSDTSRELATFNISRDASKNTVSTTAELSKELSLDALRRNTPV